MIPAMSSGEYFIDDRVFEKIQEIVERAQASNVEIEVLRYAT